LIHWMPDGSRDPRRSYGFTFLVNLPATLRFNLIR
jgi:hypothetical protein